jgi:hypothetical protein
LSAPAATRFRYRDSLPLNSRTEACIEVTYYPVWSQTTQAIL